MWACGEWFVLKSEGREGMVDDGALGYASVTVGSGEMGVLLHHTKMRAKKLTSFRWYRNKVKDVLIPLQGGLIERKKKRTREELADNGSNSARLTVTDRRPRLPQHWHAYSRRREGVQPCNFQDRAPSRHRWILPIP
jgi:hypothetical protein